MGARPGGFGGEGNWFDRSADPVERELAFETPDERLPWLESDEEGDEPPVYDTGRLVGLGLIMLVALVVLVGGVWFFANRGPGSGPAPDGSLIAAPATPYKERPVSPGGKTFAGTGDTSYAVLSNSGMGMVPLGLLRRLQLLVKLCGRQARARPPPSIPLQGQTRGMNEGP